VAKVKIWVSGVPLAPTGRACRWKPEDWTDDRAFDGLRSNIEGSNPGVITAGRPNMLGSVYAMKQAGATSCGIRFTLVRNDASDRVLSSGRVFLFGKSRNPRILRNTDLPWSATSAFRLVMLRCCVRFLSNVIFVLRIICRSPTGVDSLTALVRTVNHVATRYVGVCCVNDRTTSPVMIGAQWLLLPILPLPPPVLDLLSSPMIRLLPVCPTDP